MSRLYLRIFVGVLAVLAIALFLPEIIFHITPEKKGGPMPEDFHNKVELVKRSLDNIPADRIASELDSLRKLTGFSMSIINIDDPNIPPGSFNHEGPRPMNGGHPGEPPRIYVALPKIQKAVIIEPVFKRPRPDTKLLLVYISLTLVVVFLGAFLIIAPTIRDLRKLEIAAQQFGGGKFDWRADVKSRDAVGSVARQFNQMAEKIQRLIEQERQLLQAVSHELKTPIARMRFITEKLAGISGDKLAGGIEELDIETTEIESLVNELLDYNRLSDSISVTRQSFVLREAVQDVMERLNEFEPGIDRQIFCPVDKDIAITADLILFKRAMQNLLLNAFRFAKAQVVVKCSQNNNEIVIEVCDDGPGIPLSERERVFKPFARLENSRSRESGGVGLGLAITQRIVQRHGGSISVTDSEIGGACMVTHWPQDKAWKS
jgi:two-component system, OmpR family, sensor histidine kinase RstB